MLEISDQEFNDLIASVLDELPEKYTSRLQNVVITYEDEPNPEQRQRLKLHSNETLFGLFEGVPLTGQTNYAGGLPSRITLFKRPLQHSSVDMVQFRAGVKHTLWHEIAHYYGLDHDRIHEIEDNWK